MGLKTAKSDTTQTSPIVVTRKRRSITYRDKLVRRAALELQMNPDPYEQILEKLDALESPERERAFVTFALEQMQCGREDVRMIVN